MNALKFEKNIIHNAFVAKTDNEDSTKYLPLWMHLKDTVGIAKKLTNQWVADSVIRALGLNKEEFTKAACFLASVHDIGKAISYFQCLITIKHLHDVRNCLVNNNFLIKETVEQYIHTGETHHAYAGDEILKYLLKCDDTVDDEDVRINQYASVIGSHHGKPKNRSVDADMLEGYDYITMYSENLFGKRYKPIIKGQESADILCWKSVWQDIFDNAYKETGIDGFNDLPKINFDVQIIMSALLIMSDWMASDQYYFPLISISNIYNPKSIPSYPKRVDDAWKKLLLPKKWTSKINKMDEKTFVLRFGFMPNTMQKMFLDIINKTVCPGLFMLEGPMGYGKTEAALAAIEILAAKCGCSGAFFGLPTQATSNGLFARLIDWAKNISDDTVHSITLAHSNAELNDEYKQYEHKGKVSVNEDGEDCGIEIHPWFKGSKRSLLSDFVTGTVDQFLLATLRSKHFMLRHLGLLGKVIVIDECHAYSTYMDKYLTQTLKWMGAYGIPVILLSATLPKEKRVEFMEAYSKYYAKCFLKENYKGIKKQEGWHDTNAYPLCTWNDGMEIKQETCVLEDEARTVNVVMENDIEKMIREWNIKLQNGGCGCIIRNTIKKAQETYDMVKSIMPDTSVVLLNHAQFLAPERTRIEKEILKRMGKHSTPNDRYRVILIGTQVLEQSLDYDTDLMASDVAPIDLILQRMGREWRHNRVRPVGIKPEFTLLTDIDAPYDNGTKNIYGEYLLTRTLNVLSEYNFNITLPTDISHLVQKVYDKNYSLGETVEIKDDYLEKIKSDEQHARGYMLRQPSVNDMEILDGCLECDSTDDSEKAVRDGIDSIDVVIMKKISDNEATFIIGGNTVPLNRTPDDNTAKEIRKQRLRLPFVFSCIMSKTLRELEEKTARETPIWQESPWLNGELILLLDENCHSTLCGYDIWYDTERGFVYEKIE